MFPLHSIDLLTKFADDLQFEFDLARVEDPKWGVLGRDGKWNGLMEAVVEKRFDMALTSLKVNAEREAAVDFTAPFLESGYGICYFPRLPKTLYVILYCHLWYCITYDYEVKGTEFLHNKFNLSAPDLQS